jgi:hypothetical protein
MRFGDRPTVQNSRNDDVLTRISAWSRPTHQSTHWRWLSCEADIVRSGSSTKLSTMAGVTVTLRKLSHEETTRAFPRLGQVDVSEYAAALRALQIGDSAEFALDSLSSRAAKRRLGLAATQVGYRLKWASTKVDDRLFFRVLPATASPARAKRRQRTRSPARKPEAPTVAPSQPAATSPAVPTRPRRRRAVRTS